MTNFEHITASPETLGTFLAYLPIADGPWDVKFRQIFCRECKAENCPENCPNEAARNNPLWWLDQAADGEQMESQTVWRDRHLKLEPLAIVPGENPLQVHIRAAREEFRCGVLTEDVEAETRMEAAMQAVDEVRKIYPDAKISIEVEI